MSVVGQHNLCAAINIHLFFFIIYFSIVALPSYFTFPTVCLGHLFFCLKFAATVVFSQIWGGGGAE
jgi:hypothetical protein